MTLKAVRDRVCGLTQCRITTARTKGANGDANWTSDGVCREQAQAADDPGRNRLN